jgi:hypothetical protein
MASKASGMGARALAQPTITPKIVSRTNILGANNNHTVVEVWTTTCIVTRFQQANCTVLINPSNPELKGCSDFTYFPKGGPVPKTKVESMHKDWQPLGNGSATCHQLGLFLVLNCA